MLFGAIIGDIVGSIYEFDNIRTKEFPFWAYNKSITDDSCMTIAVAKAISESIKKGSNLQSEATKWMRDIGNRYPNMGYGTGFSRWLCSDNPTPYNSWGNGAAMRVSAAGWFGKDLNEVKHLSYMVTSVTHNHIEGIKGAEATAVAIFLARTGKNMSEIENYITTNYYDWQTSVIKLQKSYCWEDSCQGTVPPALQCVFESNSFEDAVRNAISIGGDSDTIGAIAGSVAEAYYGVPDSMITSAKTFIPDDLLKLVLELEKIVC